MPSSHCLALALLLLGDPAAAAAVAEEECSAGVGPEVIASSLLQSRFGRGSALSTEGAGPAVGEEIRVEMAVGAELFETKHSAKKVKGNENPDGHHNRESVLPHDQQTSWYAGPFGNCTSSCSPPVKEREVVCKGFFDGSTKDDSACAEHTKPASLAVCNCDDEDCGDQSVSSCKLPGPQSAGFSTRIFEEVGCYDLVEGDDPTTWVDEDDDTETKDFTCMGFSDSGPCRSGLPFFRNKSAQNAQDCYHFCTKKGLDVAGVVKVYGEVHECRCGASALNMKVWTHIDAEHKSELTIMGLQAAPEGEDCPVLVLRYNGFYDEGALPPHFLSEDVRDQAYVDSIITGAVVSPASLAQNSRTVKLQKNSHESQSHQATDRTAAAQALLDAPSLEITGGCQSTAEGIYEAQGLDANGAQYYKKTSGTHYLYYDPDCNGLGTAAAWIIDNSEPDTALTSDVDNDAQCAFFALLSGDVDTSAPTGEKTWSQDCDGSWEDQTITLDTAPAPSPALLLQDSSGACVVDSVTVYTGIWQSEVSWEIKDESGQVLCSGGTYRCCPACGEHQAHLEKECCLPAGTHTLHCKDAYGDGWNTAYVEIDGTKYAEDFTDGSSKVYDVEMGPPTPSPTQGPTPSPTPAPCEVTSVHVYTGWWPVEISWKISRGDTVVCESEAYTLSEYRVDLNPECCLSAGSYMLTCEDTWGDGWDKGYIEIDGEKFCDSFHGFENEEPLALGPQSAPAPSPSGSSPSPSGGPSPSGEAGGPSPAGWVWACPSEWYDTNYGAPSDPEAEAWTMAQNVFRCIHDIPFNKWSEPVANNLKEYLAPLTSMSHADCYNIPPPAGPAGENLFQGWGATYTPGSATSMWYEEIENCASLPGCTQSTGGATGHFTAMVWKGVQTIGCNSNSHGVKGCRYKADDTLNSNTPNMMGSYEPNVLPTVHSFEECKAAVESCFGTTMPSSVQGTSGPTSSGPSPSPSPSGGSGGSGGSPSPSGGSGGSGGSPSPSGGSGGSGGSRRRSSSPSPSPSGGGGPSTWECPSEWYDTEYGAPTDPEAEAWTMAQNTFRCMHNVPFNKWSNPVADNLKSYLAPLTSMSHADCYNIPPPAGPAGENLFQGWGASYNPGKATSMWYEEITLCGQVAGCQGGGTGHFTALIWKGVKTIGCNSNSHGVKGCRYKADDTLNQNTPNMGGGYGSNVVDVVNSFQDCKQKIEDCFGSNMPPDVQAP